MYDLKLWVYSFLTIQLVSERNTTFATIYQTISQARIGCRMKIYHSCWEMLERRSSKRYRPGRSGLAPLSFKRQENDPNWRRRVTQKVRERSAMPINRRGPNTSRRFRSLLPEKSRLILAEALVAEKRQREHKGGKKNVADDSSAALFLSKPRAIVVNFVAGR